MAEFKKMKYHNNKYIVNGIITDSDIDYFNSLNERTIFILENTKGLSSYTISKINNNNVLFSIIGGLDKIINLGSYDAEIYRNRTYLSYMGLATILYYFETIENELDENWTDTQKAMYVYSVLASNVEYVSEYDPEQFISKNVMPRSLNGILYNKLTCAGFSLIYKEMMDRLGIECYFQNKPGSHDFNILKLNDKYYGIDITWDNCYEKDSSMCQFKFFGRDIDFYNSPYHRNGVFVTDSLYDEIKSGKIELGDWIKENVYWDYGSECTKKADSQHTHFVPFIDESLYDLNVFTDEEYHNNLDIISEKLLNRKKIAIHLDEADEKTRKRFLPFDTNEEGKLEKMGNDRKRKKDRFKADIVKDYQFFKMVEYLKKYKFIDLKLIDVCSLVINYRKSFVLDFLNEFDVFSQDEIIDGYDKIRNGIKIVDENINNDIISSVMQYLKDLIDELVLHFFMYINSYELFKNSSEEYDKMVVDDIYSKIKILLDGKEKLVSLGYRSDEILKIYEIYKDYFQSKIVVDTKNDDYMFLYDVFSDLDDIKIIIENYENRKITRDEFFKKFQNVEYMLKVFDKLKYYNFTYEEYYKMFSDILMSKKENNKNRK